ncbi:hypothetical protein F442_13825 [Phytophthora nicotianae P10297]|uniref:Uncharacterized protein n=1 Tax=Phytophthora nicotianae P10297 TaxID=1317064 RepID=W2YV00_PHYNI|nr:hypothetical protein F442_13825 [Phytophthora nicotianae P10297]
MSCVTNSRLQASPQLHFPFLVQLYHCPHETINITTFISTSKTHRRNSHMTVDNCGSERLTSVWVWSKDFNPTCFIGVHPMPPLDTDGCARSCFTATVFSLSPTSSL